MSFNHTFALVPLTRNAGLITVFVGATSTGVRKANICHFAMPLNSMGWE